MPGAGAPSGAAPRHFPPSRSVPRVPNRPEAWFTPTPSFAKAGGLLAERVEEDSRSFAEPAPHHVTRRRELHEHSLLRGDMQQALLQERRARGDVIDTRPSEPAPSRSTPRDMRAPLWLDDMRSKRSTSKSAEDATLGMQLRQGIPVHPKAVSLELPWMRALPSYVQSVLGCFGLREHRRMSVREGVLLVTPAVCLAVLALVYFVLSSVAQARSALELKADVHARDAHLHGDFRIRGERTVVLENELVQVGVDMLRGGSIVYMAARKRHGIKQPGMRSNPVQRPCHAGNLFSEESFTHPLSLKLRAGPGDYRFSFEDKCGPEGVEYEVRGFGDAFGNTAKVTPLERTPTRLRLLVEPLVYGCDGVPTWFHMVQTLELEDNALWVTAQLQAVEPPPPGLAGALLQELPSAFINPLLDRLVTYTGVSPFQEESVESIAVGYSLKNQSWTPGPFMAAEHWAALVFPCLEAEGYARERIKKFKGLWGLGIYHPQSTDFAAGFRGATKSLNPKTLEYKVSKSIREEPVADTGGFLSARREIDLTFATRPATPLQPAAASSIVHFALVVGSVTQIRAFAYHEHGRTLKPRKDVEWVPGGGWLSRLGLGAAPSQEGKNGFNDRTSAETTKPVTLTAAQLRAREDGATAFQSIGGRVEPREWGYVPWRKPKPKPSERREAHRLKESRKHESWVDEHGMHLAPDVLRRMQARKRDEEAGMSQEDPAAPLEGMPRHVSDAAARRSQMREGQRQKAEAAVEKAAAEAAEVARLKAAALIPPPPAPPPPPRPPKPPSKARRKIDKLFGQRAEAVAEKAAAEAAEVARLKAAALITPSPAPPPPPARPPKPPSKARRKIDKLLGRTSGGPSAAPAPVADDA